MRSGDTLKKRWPAFIVCNVDTDEAGVHLMS